MISTFWISKMSIFFPVQKLFLPKNYFNSISPQNVHVELWFINVDFNFFLGYETTHKVKNLVFQKLIENNESRHKPSSAKKKISRRSLLPIVFETCLQYCQKKRVGLPVLTFRENEANEFIFDDANKRHYLWSLMQVRSIPQSVPSWTGFQILVCNSFAVLRKIVGYLDCNDVSATEMSTIYHVK